VFFKEKGGYAMKNLFAMLAIAAIMTLPAGPMLDAGKTVAADADTIIAKKGDPNTGPGGWKDAPKPPGWSKSKKTSKLEVLPGNGVMIAKGSSSSSNRPSPPGWSGKKGK
jgi:hypothetical protein